jgi:hypothetical protein
MEPPIDLSNGEPKPTEPDFVDFSYHGKVILVGLERPPHEFEKPRLLMLLTTRYAI